LSGFASKLRLSLREQSFLSIAIATAIWLCPLWLQPTAIVPSLLWAAAGLGGLLLLDTFVSPQTDQAELQKLFLGLLAILAIMIAWRSSNTQNAVAASLSLICIALAATLSAKPYSIRPAEWIAWGWLLAGLFNSAFGLFQYLGHTYEPLGMAFGFLRQRNNFATLCNIALVALLYLWHQKALPTKYALLAGFLLAAGLAATASRTGLLGIAAIGLLMCMRSHLRKPAALLALAYCLCAWVLPKAIQSSETIAARVSSTAQGGQLQDSRRIMWHNTITLIEQNPLVGVGWREIDRSLHLADFGADPAQRFPGQVDNAHNLPLQFAAELGVPFTAVWLIALIWLVLRNKPWRTRSPEQLLGWGVLLVIGIHSMLEYPLWYAPFQIAVGLAAGLVFTRQISNQNRPAGHIQYGLAGIVLLAFAVYAAFDFHRVRQLFIPASERFTLYQNQPMHYAQASWLFAAQVRYAKLSRMPKTPENAGELYALAVQVFHFSAEPWVLKVMIESGEQLAPNHPQIAADVALYKRQLASILATDQAAGIPTLK
jgi:O-antigen ligase